MNSLNRLSSKILTSLRVKPVVGGLEISDSALRFADFDGKNWEMTSLRLPPGVVKLNKIIDREKFIQILIQLNNQIASNRSHSKKISVIASLVSADFYTQVLTLPAIREEELEEAIHLNIKMVSPIDFSETYSGWQIVGRDEGSSKIEVLAAFVNKKIINDIKSALGEAGFLAIGMEFRALSLVRLAREYGQGINKSKPFIVMSLNNESLDFMVVRHGQLYFEYFDSWSNIRGEDSRISLSDFKTVITRHMSQVLNFYNQHWHDDPVGEVVLIAPGLTQEIKQIIKDNFSLEVKEFDIGFDRNVNPEWFVAIGAGMRGSFSRRDDRDISLLGIDAREEFMQEQILGFLSFWRILIPTSLLLLAILFLLSNFILARMNNSLNDQLSILGEARIQEANSLKAEAQQFNHLIAAIKSVRDPSLSRAGVLGLITEIVRNNNLELTGFNFQDFNTQLVLTGNAKSEADIISFKDELIKNPKFSDVQLSFGDIRSGPGQFSFSIKFSVISEKQE